MLELGPFGGLTVTLLKSIATVVRHEGSKVVENTHVEQCASRAVNVTVRLDRMATESPANTAR